MGKVLVIDDDEAMRGTITKILQRDGHEVRQAADGEVGIEAFRAEPADVVITDLLMPVKEGIETIIELRELSPTVRILAMSGGIDTLVDSRLSDARDLGADEVLPKPFTVDQLRTVVAKLVAATASPD